MAAQISTTIRTLSLAISTHLRETLDLEVENVKWWAEPAIPKRHDQTKEIFLRWRRAAVNPGMWEAGGSHTTVVQRLLDVYPRRHMNASTSDHEAFLFDEDFGSLTWEETVIRAMLLGPDGHEYIPEDEDGNTLAIQPISLAAAAEMVKQPGAVGWGEGTYTFQVVYSMLLRV